jgi:hypothetical protein
LLDYPEGVAKSSVWWALLALIPEHGQSALLEGNIRIEDELL